MKSQGYRYVWKAIKYPRKQGGKIKLTPAYIIGMENRETKEVFPHPLTHFIYKNFHRNSGSINSELSVIQVVVPFLNFVLNKADQNDLDFKDVRGLEDLNLIHANKYLEHCVIEKGNTKKTLEIKENHLSKLYKYLMNEGILKNQIRFIESTFRSSNEIKRIYKLDFLYKKTDETLVRKKVKRKDIVPQGYITSNNRMQIRLETIREILFTAKYEVPDIAFGVALQIFGGLRRGELLNLNRKALKSQNGLAYGMGGLILEIRDRQGELFSRLPNLATLQVKNPRDQSCLIDPMLNFLYKHYIENVLVKYPVVKNKDALFYDSKGNPMSAETYNKKFGKLKDAYLGRLLGSKGRYQDYLDLAETKWATHIGRGVFTNLCIDAGFKDKQTAVLRGDKSTQSMEAYYDILTATFNIRKALERLHTTKNEDIYELARNKEDIKIWKDVIRVGKENDS